LQSDRYAGSKRFGVSFAIRYDLLFTLWRDLYAATNQQVVSSKPARGWSVNATLFVLLIAFSAGIEWGITSQKMRVRRVPRAIGTRARRGTHYSSG